MEGCIRRSKGRNCMMVEGKEEGRKEGRGSFSGKKDKNGGSYGIEV